MPHSVIVFTLEDLIGLSILGLFVGVFALGWLIDYVRSIVRKIAQWARTIAPRRTAP